MTARGAHRSSQQVVRLEEARARALPAPGVLQLVAEHRTERAIRDSRLVAPEGKPVRRALVQLDLLRAHRAKDGHRVRPDPTLGVEVGKRRRPLGPDGGDDVGDDGAGDDPRVGAGRLKLGAKPVQLEHRRSLS